jgi:long-chain fatty acid transport protein
MRVRLLLVALLAAGLAAPSARGAGFGRPVEIGARAVGLAGAYAAAADDPSAVWHDPAALAFPDETQLYLDAALVLLGRTWQPPGKPRVDETTPPQPIPTLGASTRFAFGSLKPSRLALGVAFYSSYGGAIAFDPASVSGSIGSGAAGLTQTSLALLEVAPALAYQVADALALGVALRIGISTFSVDDQEPAFTASGVSAVGAGVGATFGATVRPHPRVAIGAVYRTPLSTGMSGSGNLSIAGGPPTRRDLTLQVTWPQSAALGLSVRAAPFLRLVAQADWTGWSSLQELDVAFGGTVQVRPLRFADSYTLRAGAEATVWRLQLRVGGAVDSNAIPDATSRREDRDGWKYDLTAGIGVRFWRMRIDAAVDALLGVAPRVVAPAPAAEAGTYSGRILSFELSASAAF